MIKLDTNHGHVLIFKIYIYKMKKIILVLISTLVIIFSFNYFNLQKKLNKVLIEDSRNKGINVFCHYNNFIDSDVIIFNIWDVGGDNSMVDVDRVFLQFSEIMKNEKFKKVVFSYKFKNKFYLKGDYFKELGEEYSFQNPGYTIRTLPENIYNMNDEITFPKSTGGWLGILNDQMENHNNFHRMWYMNDLQKKK